MQFRLDVFMAKINPFHTNSHEYAPSHHEVYHDSDACPDGKRIKHEHRVEGTAQRRHCLEPMNWVWLQIWQQQWPLTLYWGVKIFQKTTFAGLGKIKRVSPFI